MGHGPIFSKIVDALRQKGGKIIFTHTELVSQLTEDVEALFLLLDFMSMVLRERTKACPSAAATLMPVQTVG